MHGMVGSNNIQTYIPHGVVEILISEDCSLTRAWRKYLGIQPHQLAAQLGISYAAYIQHEKSHNLRKPTRNKIAKVLGIDSRQLGL